MVGLAYEDALLLPVSDPIIGAAAVIESAGLFASRDAMGIETPLLGSGAPIAS